METTYCLKVTKEIYVKNISEQEASKMLDKLVKQEYKNTKEKIQINSELLICL